jgi:uncharacterized YccA/Bax inhibitor family protein
MRTSNPVLTRSGTPQPDRSLDELLRGDPVSATVERQRTLVDAERLTIDGVVVTTLGLLGLVVAAAAVGWNLVSTSDAAEGRTPAWMLGVFVAVIGLAIAAAAVPQHARLIAPAYSVVVGVLAGVVSKVYEVRFDGIVLQAIGLTVGVFMIMLILFLNRTIRCTPRLRVGIASATLAVLVVYLLSFVLRLFGADIPFIHDSGPLGILFSLVVVTIAAFNLILDFDAVERSVAANAPRTLRWNLALGLVATLVWLYLEMLRLLGKLRR